MTETRAQFTKSAKVTEQKMDMPKETTSSKLVVFDLSLNCELFIKNVACLSKTNVLKDTGIR